MDGDWYTWKEFCDLARELMPLEKQRLDLQDSEDGAPGHLTLQIRQAVIDLQRFIPAYLKNHESIYDPEDFALDGSASRGATPPGALLKEFWVFNTETGVRHPVISFPHERRHELIHGMANVADQQARLALDPHGETFWVYPAVEPGWCLVMNWDAKGTTNIKLDFKDDEKVPFGEDAAKAVSEYAHAQIARIVDRDLAMHESWMRSYLTSRKDLYLESKDKARFQ